MIRVVFSLTTVATISFLLHPKRYHVQLTFPKTPPKAFIHFYTELTIGLEPMVSALRKQRNCHYTKSARLGADRGIRTPDAFYHPDYRSGPIDRYGISAFYVFLVKIKLGGFKSEVSPTRYWYTLNR